MKKWIVGIEETDPDYEEIEVEAKTEEDAEAIAIKKKREMGLQYWRIVSIDEVEQ